MSKRKQPAHAPYDANLLDIARSLEQPHDGILPGEHPLIRITMRDSDGTEHRLAIMLDKDAATLGTLRTEKEPQP
jgi:hypothetical protein